MKETSNTSFTHPLLNYETTEFKSQLLPIFLPTVHPGHFSMQSNKRRKCHIYLRTAEAKKGVEVIEMFQACPQ